MEKEEIVTREGLPARLYPPRDWGILLLEILDQAPSVQEQPKEG